MCWGEADLSLSLRRTANHCSLCTPANPTVEIHTPFLAFTQIFTHVYFIGFLYCLHNCIWNIISAVCLSSVLQRTSKTFQSSSTMHRRQFFTPLHLFMTLRINRSVGFGNGMPTVQSTCASPLITHVHTNDWLNNASIFVLPIFFPS